MGTQEDVVEEVAFRLSLGGWEQRTPLTGETVSEKAGQQSALMERQLIPFNWNLTKSSKGRLGQDHGEPISLRLVVWPTVQQNLLIIK